MCVRSLGLPTVEGWGEPWRRPPMPILTLVVPQLRSNGLSWSLSGRSVARQCLIERGLLPVLAAPSPSGAPPPPPRPFPASPPPLPPPFTWGLRACRRAIAAARLGVHASTRRGCMHDACQ